MMAKMTLEELRKLRDAKKGELDKRDTEGKNIHIIIGMGTCGIAAGAKDSLDAFLDEIEKNKIDNVTVKQTGCMGLCYVEPTVEVKVPGMPDTIYGNVDAATARSIITDHVLAGKLVDNHIFDRPAKDIVKE